MIPEAYLAVGATIPPGKLVYPARGDDTYTSQRMRADPYSIRATGLAATATTLVAMVAMSATVSGAPAPRALDAQVRATLSESHVARVVAAAVAAAARDLLGGEQWTTAVALLEDPAGCGAHAIWCTVTTPAWPFAPLVLLDERLLDLPPPSC